LLINFSAKSVEHPLLSAIKADYQISDSEVLKNHLEQNLDTINTYTKITRTFI
jgi:hypothetical protein